MPIEGAARIEGKRTLALLAMCAVIGVLVLPVRPGVVLGESMAPAFHSGQVFLKTSVSAPEALRRGDAVLLTLDGQIFLKRIYALPGETVWTLESVTPGRVVRRIVPPVEVAALRAITARHGGDTQLDRTTVPEQHVFVLGDSPSNSYDSRHFGPVPWEAIEGRVIVSRLFRLWGPNPDITPVARAGETAYRNRG